MFLSHGIIVFYQRKGPGGTSGYEDGAKLCFIRGKDRAGLVGAKTGQNYILSEEGTEWNRCVRRQC